MSGFTYRAVAHYWLPLSVLSDRALGHAANRGKVYYLHPELFKVITAVIIWCRLVIRVCVCVYMCGV